jgi:hypothetical protein
MSVPLVRIHPKLSYVAVEGKLMLYDRLAMIMICR